MPQFSSAAVTSSLGLHYDIGLHVSMFGVILNSGSCVSKLGCYYQNLVADCSKISQSGSGNPSNDNPIAIA